jgi:NAD(P) transhydrogenase subunit alpha
MTGPFCGEERVKICIVKEMALDERRVAGTPETVKKFKALGAEIAVEAGAGLSAAIADADYAAVGATIADRAATAAGADIILGVQGPDVASISAPSPVRGSSRV